MPHSSVIVLPAYSTVAKQRHSHLMNQPAAKHTSTHSGQWPRAKSSRLSNGALIRFKKTSPAARVSAERCSLCCVSLRRCRGYCVLWFYIIKVCTCCFMSMWGLYRCLFRTWVNMVGTQSSDHIPVMRRDLLWKHYISQAV